MLRSKHHNRYFVSLNLVLNVARLIDEKVQNCYSCNVMNRSINEAFEKGITDDASPSHVIGQFGGLIFNCVYYHKQPDCEFQTLKFLQQKNSNFKNCYLFGSESLVRLVNWKC